MDLVDAIEQYYSIDPDQNSDTFLEACQVLIDTGFWLLMEESVFDICTALIKSEILLPPEADQQIGQSDLCVKGKPRKFH